MQAFIIPSGCAKATMLAFLLHSGWTKDCMLTTPADSFFTKKNACLLLTSMCTHSNSLDVAASSEIWNCHFTMGSWSICDLWSVFSFIQHVHLLSQPDNRKAQHTCRLTCGWITCCKFKNISQCQFWLEGLDFTSWFWHGLLMILVLVLVLVHHSCTTLPLSQCY